MTKSFAWHSKDKSIANKNKHISVAACIETAWSVFLYWLIWWWFETHWHLLSSLVAAPFLLLRSPASIEQGVSWFIPKKDMELKSKDGILSFLLVLFITFLCCWLLSTLWLQKVEGTNLFWYAIIIGALCYSIAVSVSVLLYGTETIIFVSAWFLALCLVFLTVRMLSGIVPEKIGYTIALAAIAFGYIGLLKGEGLIVLYYFFSPLHVAGIWLATVAIRFYATLKHFSSGCDYFSDNWRENMFFIDPFHPVYLIPGDDKFEARNYVRDLYKKETFDGWIALFYYFFIYVPAFIYRWSIKSTFWFYWPVLYIQSGQLKQTREKDTFNRTITSHPLEKLRLFLAFATLATSVYFSFSKPTFLDIHSTNPAMIFPYLLAIDITAIKPWQWLQIATAILTIVLWSKAWTIALEEQTARDHKVEYDWSKIEVIRQLFRLRNLTTWSYLFVGLVFSVLYFGGYKELPDSWIMWLSNFFDTQFGSKPELAN